MARPTTRRLRAILLHALLKATDKEAKQLRDELLDGSSHQVQVAVIATIDDKFEIEEAIRGGLTVGHGITVADHTAADPAHLVAYLLSFLTAKRREQILDELPASFTEAGGKLPELEERSIAEAKAFLERLRVRGPDKSQRGSVRFSAKAED